MKFRVTLVVLFVLMTILIYVNKGVDAGSKKGAVSVLLVLFGVIFFSSYALDRRRHLSQ